jgi:hypothetical protein
VVSAVGVVLVPLTKIVSLIPVGTPEPVATVLDATLIFVIVTVKAAHDAGATAAQATVAMLLKVAWLPETFVALTQGAPPPVGKLAVKPAIASLFLLTTALVIFTLGDRYTVKLMVPAAVPPRVEHVIVVSAT